jgi:glycosyltransferase involved in cell wall biosynthesis
MRVVQVVSSLCTGGAERVAMALAGELTRRGHEVALVSLEEPPDGALLEPAQALGLEVVRVGKRPGGVDVGLIARLARLFKDRGPDVVHTHNALALLYAAPPARLRGARVVHTAHGPDGDRALRIALRRAAAGLVHAFVAVSEQTADFCKRAGSVDASRVRVVPNGVACPIGPRDRSALRHAVRARLGLADDALVVGTVGRMVPVKNHALLVEAVAPLLTGSRHLVVAGDGPVRAATEALATRLGVAERCRFPGATSDPGGIVAAIDLFVLTSDAEGLPLALLEAMRAGVPAIATAVGGVAEVIERDLSGWLVPPGELRALRRALAVALDQPELRASVADRGRERIEQRHSLERMADRYLALYRGIDETRVSGRRAGAAVEAARA